MSDQTLKITPQLLQQIPQVNAEELDIEADTSAAHDAEAHSVDGAQPQQGAACSAAD